MANPSYDPTLKTLVETSPEDWPVVTGLPIGPTDVIDAEIATVSGAGDKVLLVRATPPYLLHLEFHSGHDALALPAAMHVRSALLHKRHRLPVRSVAILLRPEADSPTVTGTWELGFPDEPPYHLFRYRVLRLWQLPPDPFLQAGPGLLLLACIAAVTEAELPGIITQMEQRLRTRRLRPHASLVWAAAYLLLGLRHSSAFARILLQGVQSMRESTTYQEILEEGRREGQQEGALRELRQAVRIVGEDLWGTLNVRQSRLLDNVTEAASLRALLVRAYHCHSWEELLQDLGASRGRRQPPRKT